jgi:hypothetical protein
VRRWELNIKLCCFTVKHGGCRGKVLSRVFELREQIRMFSEQEHKYDLTEKFSDANFLAKLAYLSDIFGKLN